MVFTTSLLKVFAKESASALGEQDKEKLGRIYRYTYVSTILVISFITGMITPWTREILLATLGDKYTSAANILILLLLYPIYQSL